MEQFPELSPQAQLSIQIVESFEDGRESVKYPMPGPGIWPLICSLRILSV